MNDFVGNVSTTGPIHALSAFEKMIQSLENEDPTPPTSLPPAPPTSLPLAPPTLPAITVESSLTKKQDIKWMEFVQGESGGQNEVNTDNYVLCESLMFVL